MPDTVPLKWLHVDKEWMSWQGMKKRCRSKQPMVFKYYGAKGITVCERWRTNFLAFLQDMGRAPTPSHSIDRIDNTKGYEPANCRWATPHEQQLNTSKPVWITIGNKTRCISDWAKIRRINRGTITARIKAGWDEKDAIRKPVDHRFNPRRGSKAG